MSTLIEFFGEKVVIVTGGYAPRFQAFSLAQANSVKMALSCPARQLVTQAVGRLILEIGGHVDNGYKSTHKNYQYRATTPG